MKSTTETPGSTACAGALGSEANEERFYRKRQTITTWIIMAKDIFKGNWFYYVRPARGKEQMLPDSHAKAYRYGSLADAKSTMEDLAKPGRYDLYGWQCTKEETVIEK